MVTYVEEKTVNLTVTLITLGAAAALGAFSNYMYRKPYVPGTPHYVPYLALQFLAAIVVIVMLAHLVTLFTGFQIPGRTGR